MREIKFRAWNKDIKQYDCFNLQQSGYFSEILKSDNHIVEQYTGLKDKNGVEIYEGDIIKVDGFFTYKTSVDFEEHKILNECCEEVIHGYNIGNSSNDVEVVGNIHENGDLL